MVTAREAKLQTAFTARVAELQKAATAHEAEFQDMVTAREAELQDMVTAREAELQKAATAHEAELQKAATAHKVELQKALAAQEVNFQARDLRFRSVLRLREVELELQAAVTARTQCEVKLEELATAHEGKLYSVVSAHELIRSNFELREVKLRNELDAYASRQFEMEKLHKEQSKMYSDREYRVPKEHRGSFSGEIGDSVTD
jgi:hypothetical protein